LAAEKGEKSNVGQFRQASILNEAMNKMPKSYLFMLNQNADLISQKCKLYSGPNV
jgi:hypothetical protein